MPHELAGKPVPPEYAANVGRLVTAYFTQAPDPADPTQRVAFGTSGHRGSSLRGSFNEGHVLAVVQAVCDHRKAAGIDGPLFLGVDTHALSEAARASALEVLVGNDVQVRIEQGWGYSATPVVSHAILRHNRGRTNGLADGLIVTPSHNPPEDGGIKYNPPHGGPAGTDITGSVESRANALLTAGLRGVLRVTFDTARTASVVREQDLIGTYVSDLVDAIDLEVIRASGLRLGVHPLGGAALPLWERIAEVHSLDLSIVDRRLDGAFAFMRLDHDGAVRMDCSSPWAMAGLVELKERFDLAFGNDPDADRHGIVTPDVGLMNPNHFLCAAIDYVARNRTGWDSDAGIGKTLVSSSLIDRVVAAVGRRLVEVPVGFKWFVEGLFDGSLCFGGEESAGASFLDRNGLAWSTDKDGPLLCLLAAEMTARTGKTPSRAYTGLEELHGRAVYKRLDVRATPAQKVALSRLDPSLVTSTELAGEAIEAVLVHAPGNGARIGGLKVVTANGWFAARPSGTEDIYKIYAESLKGDLHLDGLLEEAQTLVGRALET